MMQRQIQDLIGDHGVTELDLVWRRRGETMTHVRMGEAIRPSPFAACSVSKWVTAVVILKLVEANHLSLDQAVNHLLSSWTLTDESGTDVSVTIRQLIRHQAGIIDPPSAFGPYDTQSGVPTMHSLLSGETVYCPTRVVVDATAVGVFHYSDAAYCVLQLVIEDISRRSFEQAASDILFRPLGMTSSTYEPTDMAVDGTEPDGANVPPVASFYPYAAASGLWTTALDLMKLIDAVRDASFLDPSLRDIMFVSNPTVPFVGHGLFLDQDHRNEGSSLGWGIGFQSLLVLYPDDADAFVCLTNRNEGKHQMEGVIGKLYRLFRANP